MVKGNVTSSWVALLRSSKGNSKWLTKSVGNCSLAVESCNDGVVDVVEGMIEGGWSRGWQCARDAGPYGACRRLLGHRQVGKSSTWPDLNLPSGSERHLC